ncbi:hypothetical protein GCM10007933_07920 [Zoogloea oryzae]|uniref:Uncharacterized protein n=1 Tax=Zoogloea oryzae TaxID=310767 RepID=A0ABQ6F714_9RHOO|nr:hypothetical protein [Zoogloea oryzae]GLT21340.1 hypothetical protein GCM10007933_07920 [Zoogloea oryzae]
MASEVFNLDRYKPLSEFSELQWFGQITKRKAIWDALRAGDHDIAGRRFRDVLADPLCEYMKNRVLIEEIKTRIGYGAVKPLTFEEIESLHVRASSLVPVCGSRSFRSFDEAVLSQGTTIGFLVADRTYLSISLTASNEEILSGVKDWLKKRRAMSGGVLASQYARNLIDEAGKLKESADLIMRFLEHELFHQKMDLSNAKNSLLEIKLFLDDNPDITGEYTRIPSLLADRLDDDESGPQYFSAVEGLIEALDELLRQNASGSLEIAHGKEAIANRILGDIQEGLDVKCPKKLIKSWEASGVIPYFDLRAWEMINNLVLTGDERAALLSKNDPRSLSQTTEVHFEKLFETSFVHSFLLAYLGS